MRRHVEIVGGGIGGLTAAAALAQRGWSVRLHERFPELPVIGAGIYVWENGLRVLEAIGAFNGAVAGAHRAHCFEIRDGGNRLTALIPFNARPEWRLFTIVRRQLTEAIVAAGRDAGVEIVTGSNAVAAAADGELIMADGTRHKADLVVAADGINSRLRDSLGLLRSRRRLIDGAIRMLIPFAPGDVPTEDEGKYIEFWSGTRRLLYTPCNERDLYLALTCLDVDAAAKRLPIDKPLWQASFPHLARLIGRIGEQGRWDLFEEVELRRWSTGRVAVLGDAAHAQAPNLGQGGGCAMMNGLSLAVALDEYPDDIPAALDLWERRERAIIEHTQRVAGLWGRLTTWPDERRAAAFNRVGRSERLTRMQLRTAMHAPTGTAKP